MYFSNFFECWYIFFDWWSVKAAWFALFQQNNWTIPASKVHTHTCKFVFLVMTDKIEINLPNIMTRQRDLTIQIQFCTDMWKHTGEKLEIKHGWSQIAPFNIRIPQLQLSLGIPSIRGLACLTQSNLGRVRNEQKRQFREREMENC